MPIPALFTSPVASLDLTKFGPTHWNNVSGLLTALLDGADADGTVLTRSAASATGATWGAAPPAAAGTLTGATLAANVLASSLTSIGSLVGLVVTGASLFTRDAIAVTSTDGLVLQNTALATAGVPVQQSPRLRFRSHVWNTTAVAADNTDDWIIESIPASSATPMARLAFSRSLNGGAYAERFSIDSGGTIWGVPSVSGVNNLNAVLMTGPQWRSQSGDNTNIQLSNAGLLTVNRGTGPQGVGLDVATDAILKIRTRAQSADASLTALNLTASGSVFATAGNVWAASCIANGSGSLMWDARARMYSPADGIVRLADAAGTSFARLQFGGTTSAFPSLKRNGAGLEARLADDSGYANLTGATMVVMSSVSLVATSILNWNTRSVLSTPADGQFVFRNNGDSAGIGLDFATDSILKVRNRAHSGYATLDAFAYRASGVAGVSFGPAQPNSITTVNGIVTAISEGDPGDSAGSLFRLTANGSALGPTIADFFGADSALVTELDAIYELVFHVKFLKTSLGTVTWTLTNTAAYTNLVAQWTASGNAGVGTLASNVTAGIVATTTAAAAMPVGSSLTASANHEVVIRALAECGAAGNLRLRVTCSAGSVTPLRGSYYTARKLSAANVGTFAA
jgi:hypothetical protein